MDDILTQYAEQADGQLKSFEEQIATLSNQLEKHRREHFDRLAWRLKDNFSTIADEITKGMIKDSIAKVAEIPDPQLRAKEEKTLREEVGSFLRFQKDAFDAFIALWKQDVDPAT